ncbi:uncharacterized protein LOC115797501 [Archocentrus centrarchus]|uniref:uncharacterized protein LOC115797501 n=1 Tax=Archocentrus centrarchus TaxID=63155 RepID=UPI0011E9D192|nr:uncharacterized protein LOC115797501 [Archocentrus centrarchus]
MSYVKVILGDPFTLPENCKSDEEGTLRQEQPQSRQVAAHRLGVWIPEESFKDRINQSSSVVFNRAVYTDSGVYVLACGGRVVHIQVEVVVSSDASAKEGEAVSLPCYFSTTAGTCWSVSWAKDGEVVLHWHSCDVKSNWAADDRLSLSADWLSHGDLSLNLQQTRKNDEANYFCFIQKEGREKQKGNPAAVKLKVHERSPDQITLTPPPPPASPAQKTREAVGLGTPAAVSITAVVCLIIGGVVGGLLKSYYHRCASGRHSEGRSGPRHEHVNGALALLSPPQHVNGCPSNTTHAASPV